MYFPKITIRIEDREYHLDASDGPEIRNLPEQDKQHLLTFLMAIQKQERLQSQLDDTSYSKADNAKDTGEKTNLSLPLGSSSSQVATPVAFEAKSSINTQATVVNPKAEAKSTSGKADQIMSRLIAEEKSSKKSLNKKQMYLVSGSVALIILLILTSLI